MLVMNMLSQRLSGKANMADVSQKIKSKLLKFFKLTVLNFRLLLNIKIIFHNDPRILYQELLNRVDVVDIIDKRVHLKKQVQNFIACCPFHQEKTPSFTVSPSKQFYHCFGCGEHGSAISFLIEYEGLTFIDAINELANSIGLKGSK